MYPAADIGLSDYFSYALNPLNLRNHGLHLVKTLSRHQGGEDTGSNPGQSLSYTSVIYIGFLKYK